MSRCCLAFVAGAATASRLPYLPPASAAVMLLAMAVVLALAKKARPLAALLAGCAVYLQSAGVALHDRLPPSQYGNDFTFEAEIIDFTKVKGDRTTLLVAPVGNALPGRLRLGWYHAEDTPRLGERWRFVARLRRPRGQRNPGTFDYAGWLHRQRIGASGYVLEGERLSGAARRPGSRLRRQLVERVETLLPGDDARAALLAIAVGARHRITAEAWRRYATTGTSHLMAISGLHVGLAATAAGILGWGLVGSIAGRFAPQANLRDLALLCALPAAAGYAALSGFAVPAQRALLMTAAAALLWLLRRPARPAAALAGIAALVVAADPLAVLAPGFWLSFGAVAVLLAAAGYGGPAPACAGGRVRARLRELTLLQLALLLGLFPLTAGLFGRAAWLAPLANLVVLPVFSAVTVPSALLGLLFGGPAAALGDTLLWLSWYSLRALIAMLDAFAALPGSELRLAAPHAIARFLYLLPLAFVVLPPGFPGRRLAWLAFAAALVERPPPPPNGCLDVHTLDVGQGLAMVLQTEHRTLVFDTGPAYRGGGSSAERVILPFLESRGIRRIDRLVVSHADEDHAGGVELLLRELEVGDILAGEALPGDLPHRLCRRGEHWHWDGVDFRILHPADGSEDGNDASCVLEAASGPVRTLLTGDIGGRVERRLAGGGELRPVALVQVPHHGSRTSSSTGFVTALGAQSAVVSAGYRNRWGFPKDDVAERWRASGADLVVTAESGAIHHRLCAERGAFLVSEYRLAARRYWHDVDD